MPRPSAIPPAAMTGTCTASTTCGTRTSVPSCDAAHFWAKGRTRAGGKCRRTHPELSVVRREPLEPCRLECRITLRHVAEKVQVQRLGGLRPDLADEFAHLRRRQC